MEDELLDYRSIPTKLVSGFRLLLQLPLEPDRNLKHNNYSVFVVVFVCLYQALHVCM